MPVSSSNKGRGFIISRQNTFEHPHLHQCIHTYIHTYIYAHLHHAHIIIEHRLGHQCRGKMLLAIHISRQIALENHACWICVCTCMHTHLYVYPNFRCVCTCVYMCAYVFIRISTLRVCIRIYTHIHTSCVHTDLYAYPHFRLQMAFEDFSCCICMCACVYALLVYMRIYTYVQTSADSIWRRCMLHMCVHMCICVYIRMSGRQTAFDDNACCQLTCVRTYTCIHLIDIYPHFLQDNTCQTCMLRTCQ